LAVARIDYFCEQEQFFGGISGLETVVIRIRGGGSRSDRTLYDNAGSYEGRPAEFEKVTKKGEELKSSLLEVYIGT